MNLRDMKKDRKDEEVVDSSGEVVNDKLAVEDTVPEKVVDTTASEEVTVEKVVEVEAKAEVETKVPTPIKEAPIESKEEKRKIKAEAQLLKNRHRRKTAAKVNEVSEIKGDPTQTISFSELPNHTGNNIFEAMNTMITELADQNMQLRSMNTEMINEMKKVNNKIIEMLDRPIEPKVVIMQPETTKVITKTITRDTNNLIQSVTEKVEDVPVDEKEIITKKGK